WCARCGRGLRTSRRSPASRRRTIVPPKEPVPPVTSTVAPDVARELLMDLPHLVVRASPRSPGGAADEFRRTPPAATPRRLDPPRPLARATQADRLPSLVEEVALRP